MGINFEKNATAMVNDMLDKRPYTPSGEDWLRSVNEQYEPGKSTFHDHLAGLLAEVDLLRSVLNFADGRSVMGGYRLADLFAEDSDAQGVLERAECHPRTPPRGS